MPDDEQATRYEIIFTATIDISQGTAEPDDEENP